MRANERRKDGFKIYMDDNDDDDYDDDDDDEEEEERRRRRSFTREMEETMCRTAGVCTNRICGRW